VPAAKRVGLGGRGLIGVDLMAALRAALPDVAWVDVEDALKSHNTKEEPRSREDTGVLCYSSVCV